MPFMVVLVIIINDGDDDDVDNYNNHDDDDGFILHIATANPPSLMLSFPNTGCTVHPP